MSPKALRVIGIVLLIVAAAMFVLNLKRVANAGTFWLALPLLVIGLAFIARARRARL